MKLRQSKRTTNKSVRIYGGKSNCCKMILAIGNKNKISGKRDSVVALQMVAVVWVVVIKGNEVEDQACKRGKER